MVSAEVVAKLPAVLKPVSGKQGGNAAVALLLKAGRGDFDLLLVKRVENPSDTWSGQMALPGGKRELKDASLKDTVVRETLEEIGLALGSGRFLGVLGAVRSEPKPDFKILPFVVLLDDEPRLKLNKAELETFVWVPYEAVVKSRGTVQFSFGKVPAYIFSEGIVWGITYSILSEFIEAVENTQT
ncbi:CoA pyrophosphatase [Candidatus Bathyarchaeota archaeon]|nr:CoA pyrophosphatase [Candidatus Bathyarchaeota archaeon]